MSDPLSRQISANWLKIAGSSVRIPQKHKKKPRRNRVSSRNLTKIARYLTAHGVFAMGNDGKRSLCSKVMLFTKVYRPTGTPEQRETILFEFLSKIKTWPQVKESVVVNPVVKTEYNSRKTFYDSDEWRALRYKALKFYGRKCMVCGAIPHAENNVKIHVDHIKPRSKYPELELSFENLQILCEDCNLGKSNKDSIDYRQQPSKAE